MQNKKTFDSNATGRNHERPINSKCARNKHVGQAYNNSDSSAGQSDFNLQILQELKALSGRMAVVEKKTEKWMSHQ